nr:hypothetical protein [uncultured Cohaesibacter sp.]
MAMHHIQDADIGQSPLGGVQIAHCEIFVDGLWVSARLATPSSTLYPALINMPFNGNQDRAF